VYLKVEGIRTLLTAGTPEQLILECAKYHGKNMLKKGERAMARI